jgi:hypothetical protein
MSKLARTLALAAMLAATTLAGLTAVAQAQPTQDDPVKRAAEAQERYYSTWSYGDPAVEQGLAQERYYSTWSYGDTPTPAPAEPSGQPGWLLPVIGVLAAGLALFSVLAAMLLRRTRSRVRVRQAA